MPPQLDPSNTAPTSSQASRGSVSQDSTSWTPQPIRKLFSHFPLQTLPANRLPSRSLAPGARKQNTLFLFTTANTEERTAARVPSFNPTCLKWQTYLLTHGVEFGVRSSNNHASPSGSLPFLIPAERDYVGVGSKEKIQATSTNTVTTSTLQAWTTSRTETRSDTRDPEIALQESSFLSLIDHRLRPAWLHSFYLTSNLYSLAAPLYIHVTTSSNLVRQWQTTHLRSAALTEVRKTYTLIEIKHKEVDVLYADASKALEALEILLGDDEWFFGVSKPGMLDVAVFAYVHLVLDDDLGHRVDGKWDNQEQSQRLRVLVKRCSKLGRHRDRILRTYFT